LVQVRRRSSRRQEILIEETLMARKISNTHEVRTKDFAPKVDRRKFLAGVAIAGAVAPQAASASVASDTAAARLPSALPPTARTIAAETSTPAAELNRIGGIAGSDFMVDVIKTLDIKYLPANCASSYRGIHESLNNYGGNKMPEFLTCTHEESAIGIAHGYFKVAGKPLLSLCHGTVGLQHASMAIYNAWCDRVPVIVMGGNDLDAAHRPPGRADVPFRAGHQRAGARLHQVGRHAGVLAALRTIIRARLQDFDDAALRSGDDFA
jgi:hypothetical protein